MDQSIVHLYTFYSCKSGMFSLRKSFISCTQRRSNGTGNHTWALLRFSGKRDQLLAAGAAKFNWFGLSFQAALKRHGICRLNSRVPDLLVKITTPPTRGGGKKTRSRSDVLPFMTLLRECRVCVRCLVYRTWGRKEKPYRSEIYRLDRTNVAINGMSNRTKIQKLRMVVFGIMCA